jgi:hypothetical protein
VHTFGKHTLTFTKAAVGAAPAVAAPAWFDPVQALAGAKERIAAGVPTDDDLARAKRAEAWAAMSDNEREAQADVIRDAIHDGVSQLKKQ